MVVGDDVVKGHLPGDHPPQTGVVRQDEGQVLALHPVLHQQSGDVVARAGDIVVAAALAAVDLKGLEFSVPGVVLDVEVGEAHVVQILQEGLELPAQRLVDLGENDRVVADAVGGVLLQEHMAQAHELHLGVPVGVAGEYPHVAVVAGDEVLDDHGVGVPGGVDLVQNLLQVLPVGAGEDLLVAGEGVLPVGHAVRGLADVGGLEGQVEVVAHLLPVDEGAGVVDAVLVAQLVELFLVDEGVDEVAVDVGGHAVGGEGILVLSSQLHVAVAAADDQDGLVGKLPGHLGHVVAKGLRVLVLGADPVVDDIRAISGAGGELAKTDRLHAVGLVKGPGHAVHVDIPTEKQGLEGMFHS